MEKALLEVERLFMKFKTEQGVVTAVNDVSLTINRGETVALVGESGCGKSVTSLSIMGLIRKNVGQVEGRIRFNEKVLNQLPEREMRAIRGREISMIFQEPMTSLNPVHTIGEQIGEVFYIHTDLSKKERREKTIEMLKKVGIPRPDKIVDEYPHQLSGGMKQRVMIAMAMACNPDLLIADEPTTALDVTIQAQILVLMNELKRDYHTAILLITHDLGVVAEMADRVLVMYYGEIVEEADVETLFTNPKHPYTVGLLQSVPRIEEEQRRLEPIEGNVPLLGEVTGARLTVFAALEEALSVHSGESDKQIRREQVMEYLDMVGLNPSQSDRYPHEFSGGQRQRIGIARAIAVGPALIVADEPVSALDVSIQAQILNLQVKGTGSV